MKPVLSLEEARTKAQAYLEDREKLAKLLAEAGRKAKRYYESLLPCWESLQIFLRMIQAAMMGKYVAPAASLAMAVAGIFYFVNPFDLIPDSIPVLGLVDDACVIAFVARSNRMAISNFRKWELLFAQEPVRYWKR